MKGGILKTWIRQGRIIQPGEVIDLPAEQANLALERGLAVKQGSAYVGRGKAGTRKKA
jgi:hypothetical protein